MLFDTHVHLNDESYLDVEKIIEEALNENVKKMVVIGYDLKSSKKAVELSQKHPFIYAAIGIHPSESLLDYESDLNELEKLVSEGVVAIGEIGLDYHYPDINKDKQKDLFIKQLELAKKYDLPVIIHSRDACNDTCCLLKQYKDCYKKGIMHCYSYSTEIANELKKLGFIFGIGGVLTYKNAKEIKEVVKSLELEDLVLETDAPYLSPTPYRGTQNEPKYIKYVAKEMAVLKEIEESKVEEITYKTSCDFFGVNYEN